MAYRPTARTEATRLVYRQRLLDAARRLLAEGGYAAAGISALAERAGVATGSVYNRFASKQELLAVVFRHVAGHELTAVQQAWADPKPGAAVARAASFMLFAQIEPGHACPMSMSHAVVPVLQRDGEVGRDWLPGLLSRSYDPRLIAPGSKSGLTFGMGMTEKQGGSDVRANTTRAVPMASDPDGRAHLLTGHKWFFSAPQSDAFLVLAQAPAGLTCFLVPRVLADGTRNTVRIQRLKNKLGNKSNASSEVEFDGTWAVRVGEPGRGVPTIIDMVNHTRLDCVLGTTAGMRQSVSEAIWHARHRSAFAARASRFSSATTPSSLTAFESRRTASSSSP
ncbi:TetR family transcriptional regulator [Streptomyces sp. NPDC051286]|uniref:TetR family transcriptional regulator n=1 Tax=Streptomyces sp. NPDC051286 TaxID=3365647 RepID=UPI0037995D57